MIIGLLIAAAFASHSTPAGNRKPPTDHLWQMVAKNDDLVWYIDQRTKQRNGEIAKFWGLITYTNPEFNSNDGKIKYDLVNWIANCSQKKVGFINITSYVGGGVSSDTGTSPMKSSSSRVHRRSCVERCLF